MEEYINKTIAYYNDNSKEYTLLSRNVDMSSIQDRFISYLKKDALILDFGCGSGRDSKYFIDKGFTVEAIDGSLELCKQASEYLSINVKNVLFNDFDEEDKYDGIWACASLLHLKRHDLLNVLRKLYKALKKDGYLYVSFKHGDFEGDRSERFYIDLTESELKEVVGKVKGFNIIELWFNESSLPNRSEEWINAILLKC